ncbi:MAG: hypothetical protein COS99_05220 [Candidatus Omnitrophica bacterium CG07_land_8_20_14_0_80_42_15]|uniref:DUF1573 domain-containing protein n=1 Tax=Candidatus Aquitaenariimonas noxiae TaxID=1974741 RepID=A0A2J0KSY9_9BACT|nr:MAG: hypothetical protein COS99_05220 [Candidatus Omnitrophica bacterium CG07_land_8_20_14_0_80_42_15]
MKNNANKNRMECISTKMKQVRIIFMAAAMLFFFGLGSCVGGEDKNPVVLFFSSPGCHRCETTQRQLKKVIKTSFDGKIDIEYLDISDISNYEELISLRETYGMVLKFDFPVLYFGGAFIDGSGSAVYDKKILKAFIDKGLRTPGYPEGGKKSIDLTEYFKTFGTLTVAGAGLIDGINPCAFTAIIFFISFLSFQGYEKKKIFLGGAAFIATTFITYLLIGTGLFNSLYSLGTYKMVSTTINVSIGFLSVALGVLSLRDAFIFAKTGSTSDIILQLPKKIKAGINVIIGRYFRISQAGIGQGKRRAWAIVLSAVVVGFFVCLAEAVCTGQVYLPTIVFVFNMSGDRMKALKALVVYNLFFIAPLALIFICGMAGVTSEKFGRFVKKYIVGIKILLAIVLLGLGMALLLSRFPEFGSVAHALGSDDQAKTIRGAERKDPDEKLYWDFGKAKEGDILKHLFRIKNRTGRKVNIKQINSSCACTTSHISGSEILPGKSLEIEVVFKTKGYPGERHRYVYVHTDSREMRIVLLEIKAVIK